MWKLAVKDQHIASLHRRRNSPVGKNSIDFGVTDLPVATHEMRNRSVILSARKQIHAAVLRPDVSQRDPYANNAGVERMIKISMILMPRFFPSTRRLEHRHFLEQLDFPVIGKLTQQPQELRIPCQAIE